MEVFLYLFMWTLFLTWTAGSWRFLTGFALRMEYVSAIFPNRKIGVRIFNIRFSASHPPDLDKVIRSSVPYGVGRAILCFSDASFFFRTI